MAVTVSRIYTHVSIYIYVDNASMRLFYKSQKEIGLAQRRSS